MVHGPGAGSFRPDAIPSTAADDGDTARVAAFDDLGPAAAPRAAADLADVGGSAGESRRVVDLGTVGPGEPAGRSVEAVSLVEPTDGSPVRTATVDALGSGNAARSRRGTVDRGQGAGPRRDLPAAVRADRVAAANPDETRIEESGAGGSSGRAGRRRRTPEPPADPVAAAKEICLRLLTDRARTRHELAQALRKREISDDVAEAVLSRFDEVGLIDDAAFAGQWVRSRHRSRGLARRAISQELRRKGVDAEVAGEALAEIDEEDEERRAYELVERKLRTLTLETDEQRTTAARRLAGMLARKGYGSGIAYGVVRRALAEHGAEIEHDGGLASDG